MWKGGRAHPKMVYIVLWLTVDAFVRIFVENTEDSARWKSRQEKANKARGLWNQVFSICWDLDWKRVKRNENNEWEVAFHMQV